MTEPEIRVSMPQAPLLSRIRTRLFPPRLRRCIFFYLPDGMAHAPEIASRCVQSWRSNNPRWNLEFLEDADLQRVLKIKTDTPAWSALDARGKGDVVRIAALDRLGGVWVDPTCYCSRSLDDWIDKACKKGFFAFSRKMEGKRAPCDWFVASFPGAPLWRSFQGQTSTFLPPRKPSFRADGFRDPREIPVTAPQAFGEFIASTPEANALWRKTVEVDADPCLSLQQIGYASRDTQGFQEKLTLGDPPVWKLTDDAKLEGNAEGTVLHELLKRELTTCAPGGSGKPLPSSLTNGGRRKLRQIVLIGSVRSGTNVLRRLMCTSGSVADCGEVFHPHLHGDSNFYVWLSRQGAVHPFQYRDLW